jgi:hypothetical protein
MVSASLADTNNGLPADTQGPFSSSVTSIIPLPQPTMSSSWDSALFHDLRNEARPRLCHGILLYADDLVIFPSLHVPSIRHMLSSYANDLVIFTVPDEQDLRLVKVILVVFVGASALHTNVSKCQFTPIQC